MRGLILSLFPGADLFLIPEFMRVFHEARPAWAITENVVIDPSAGVEGLPNWPSIILRDWDCGGHTSRRRRFWFYGMEPCPVPVRRPGNPAHSVTASGWRNRDGGWKNLRGSLTAESACADQGYPELAQRLTDALPEGLDAFSAAIRLRYAVHLAGNGVPRSMAAWLAQWVTRGECQGQQVIGF